MFELVVWESISDAGFCFHFSDIDFWVEEILEAVAFPNRKLTSLSEGQLELYGKHMESCEKNLHFNHHMEMYGNNNHIYSGNYCA